MLIDLHNHTYPKSDDSFLSADELVDTARLAGLDGICITEHDSFWSPEDTAALTRRHGILVLPGAEINTDAGHVLVFGLNRYRFGMHKPSFLRAEADSLGAVLIAAHPYRRRYLEDPASDPAVRAEMLDRAIADPQLRLFDAVESFNGRGSLNENRFAHDLNQVLGRPGVGGSDAHRIQQIGTAATRFERRITSLEDLIAEIRAGRTTPVSLAAASAGSLATTV
ncbi:MAG: PHP domain-containing protein [Chloroflexota bacterium]|nr:PHP domain-containing protein [Chloroflexota bacterium]MDE2683454.1 PHP domain-containing protein [Chloroflexota bacterium]